MGHFAGIAAAGGLLGPTVAGVAGVARPSDSAIIAQALWLPFWFWGALVAALSLALLVLGLWLVNRRSRG